jgi:cytidylate kinase
MENLKPSIVISGLTSCGKTYYSHRIRDEFEIRSLTASQVLLQLGSEHGLKTDEISSNNNHHIWLDSLDEFNIYREKNLALDKEVDSKILDDILNIRNLVAESLTAGFLIANKHKADDTSLKIYMQTDYETQVSRAYISSPTRSVDYLRAKIKEKDELFQTHYY